MASGKSVHLFSDLSTFQKSALSKGNIQTVEELILTSTQEIARKCKISPFDVKNLLDTVLKDNRKSGFCQLEDVKFEGDEKFTSGDSVLDEALGGGIRTGMIWEIAGESAAGKTQFAMQASLFVQVPLQQGGLSAAACFLTTSSTLPTNRLLQISQEHELLSPSICSLDDVHTISTPTIAALLQVLSTVLPLFITEKVSTSSEKPVKLIVIDALAELFHLTSKTTKSTLFERSQQLAQLSLLLHHLASSYQVAILVLNEVIDVFDRPKDVNTHDPRNLVYREQSQWFNTGSSIPGENSKEASLGLVWANQVNARILLSRTGRRQHLGEDQRKNYKRRRLEDPVCAEDPGSILGDGDHEPVLVRRLNVIFSSVSNPVSLDYIVTEKGISVLPPSENPSATRTLPVVHPRDCTPGTSTTGDITQDTAAIEQKVEFPSVDATGDVVAFDIGTAEEEDWDKLWSHDEAYSGIDWDALEESLTQVST